MKLRCILDGLLLPAVIEADALVAWDGDEGFTLEALEAAYYEVISATPQEWLAVERAHYRLLKRAADFTWEDDRPPPGGAKAPPVLRMDEDAGRRGCLLDSPDPYEAAE